MAKILSAGPATTLAIEHLLGEPDDEAADAVREVVEADGPSRELVGDVAVADDRAGDELRKEQQVQRRVDGALLRDRVAPVDVDDVGDRVEREERDADRQQHARHDERLDVVATRNSVLTLSAKKLAYLKTPRTARFDGDREREQAGVAPRTSRAARSIAIAIQ